MRGVLFAFTGAVGPRPSNGGSISRAELRAIGGEEHEIHSHTVSHALLPPLPDDAFARELWEGRAAIRTDFGRDSRVISYPHCSCDAQEIAAATRAGYRIAVEADADPRFGAAPRPQISARPFVRDGIASTRVGVLHSTHRALSSAG